MSFEKGTFAFSIFRLSKKLPENVLERFSERKAKKLDSLKEEEEIGWVSGRHLLERRIEEDTAIFGGAYYLHLRTAQRKIPTALLNAECRMAELNYMQENGTDFVPSKTRKEIKENITALRIGSMPPQISGIPLIIDRNTEILYLGTASTKAIDTFMTCFSETFPTIEVMQITLEDLMLRNFHEPLEALPNINFSEKSKSNCIEPTWDFLTWLWYYSETEEGRLKVKDVGDFRCGIDGPITLAFVDDETGGAGETTLKKGVPQVSAEAKIALEVGKKLKKAKIVILEKGNIWSGTMDANKFTFSGFDIPDGEEMDPYGKFEERVNNLDIFRLAIEGYFKLFATTFLGDNAEEEIKKIQKWCAEKETV
jgi:hypothetical protein